MSLRTDAALLLDEKDATGECECHGSGPCEYVEADRAAVEAARGPDGAVGKWNVYCEVRREDGRVEEKQGYHHLTRATEIREKCRDIYGEAFVRVVFVERLK